MNKPIAMAVHGGAWNIPDHLWPNHQNGCRQAHARGLALLKDGASALDAVCEAIRLLEDNPTFDAGIGSFLNEAGKVELDAGLMEGKDLQTGAVLGVYAVKNPIMLARYVLEHSQHQLFSGAGAMRLVPSSGVATVAEDYHVLERERRIHQTIQNGDRTILENAWRDQQGDTVGAIALDAAGNLACGNSTGGIINKAVGRVGDAALVCAGFYADNQLGAVVCTGWGESIMRSALAMRTLLSARELGAQAAAQQAIDHLDTRANGYGGVLIMTPGGDIGAAYNTQRMAYQTEPA